MKPPADGLTVRFVMDEPYLREFHAEMVATRLPRWRFHRRLGGLALAAGAVMMMLATSGRLAIGALGLLVLMMGAGTLWRLHRRRERWLLYQRRLPTFGAQITTELSAGRLIQSSDKSTDVFGIPAGEVVESRRGWFVTYDIVHLGTEPEDEAVSTENASAYLPQEGFEPRTSRDAFAAALADGFRVRRRR